MVGSPGSFVSQAKIVAERMRDRATRRAARALYRGREAQVNDGTTSHEANCLGRFRILFVSKQTDHLRDDVSVAPVIHILQQMT